MDEFKDNMRITSKYSGIQFVLNCNLFTTYVFLFVLLLKHINLFVAQSGLLYLWTKYSAVTKEEKYFYNKVRLQNIVK